MNDVVASAALYFEPFTVRGVPWKWIEGAIRCLAAAGLPVTEVAVETIDGEISGTLNYHGFRDLFAHEARKESLTIVGLYSNPGKSRDLVLDWRGIAYFDSLRGNCFLGISDGIEHPIRRMAENLLYIVGAEFSVPYGIGYRHPLSEGADFFSVGITANPIGFGAQDLAQRDQTAQWYHEMNGHRRYLRGWFRDVFPINIISDIHLQALNLKNEAIGAPFGIGTLTLFEGHRWIWEVPETDLPRVRDLIRQLGRLICG